MDIQRECTTTCLQIRYIGFCKRMLIESVISFVFMHWKSNISDWYASERKCVLCDLTEQVSQRHLHQVPLSREFVYVAEELDVS